MPTLEGLRRQIETASDLGSVVTTMKTLAAVSIQQYEQAAEALGVYNRTIELGFRIALPARPARLSAVNSSDTHESVQDEDLPDEKRASQAQTAAIVFGSDQGMCGQFNERIAEFVQRAARDAGAKRDWIVLAVGSRVEGQLLDAGWTIHRTDAVPTSVSELTDHMYALLPQIEQLQRESQVRRLLVFHNRRVSASSFEPRQLQLLPLDPELVARWREEPWQSRSIPQFATGRRRLLSRLVQQYLFVSLFRACAESLASENASRIAAMQAAESSIEERLEELTGALNSLRQKAITQELLEVVTGFQALSRSR